MSWSVGFRLQRALDAVGKLRAQRRLLHIENSALHKLIDRRDEVIVRLEARNAELEQRLGRDSGNSNQPPSSEPPWKKRYPKREPSGKKRGGQPGHRGRFRKLLPEELMDHIEDHYPGQCGWCGGWFEGELVSQGRPWRHQVSELDPRGGAQRTEYRMYALRCRHCGKHTRATLPEGLGGGVLGPRLSAVLSTLTAGYGLSKAKVSELCGAVWGVACSAALVSRTEERVSATLQPAYAEAHAHVHAAAVLNADETSWRQSHQAGWLWGACSDEVELFRIDPSRSRQAAQRLLGEAFAGVLGCDDYNVYRYVRWRQLCWAHLVRQFKQLQAHPGEAEQKLGAALLEQCEQLFALHGALRQQQLSWRAFQQAMEPVQSEVDTLLKTATEDATLHVKTRRKCQRLWAQREALWTFVSVPGVEPTNNRAERAMRAGVLLRKRSHGTQSARGSRFIERMLTVAGTLRSQGRNVIAFVTATVQALARGDPAPQLLRA